MVPEGKPIAKPCVRTASLAAYQRPMRKQLILAFSYPSDYADVGDGASTPKALLRLVVLASHQYTFELYLQIMQELPQLDILIL